MNLETLDTWKKNIQNKWGTREQNAIPSLRVNFIWTLVGNLVYSACQWGIVVIIAKLGTPSMVGQFTLGLAITAPIIMLGNLQLRSVQATDARNEYRFGDYFRLRLLTTFIALMLILGIVFGSGYEGDTAWVIILIAMAKSAESTSDIIYGAFQKREKMNLVSTSLMLRGVLSLGALGVTLMFSRSLPLATAVFTLSWLLVLITFDFHNLGKYLGINPLLLPNTLGRNWNFKILFRLAYLSLPLGIVMMLISLNINIPRYFLERMRSPSELGYFVALSYIVLAGNTLITAVGQSASPRLARYSAEDPIAFRKLVLKLIGLGAGAGTIGILFSTTLGSWLITILYRPDYAEHVDIFVLLTVGMGVGFISSILGYCLTAMRRFTIQVPMFLIIVLATLMFCWWFIPVHGMVAAAWTLLLSASLQTLMEIMLIGHTINKNHERVHI